MRSNTKQSRVTRAFTLVETMVASSVAMVVLGGGFLFLNTVIRSTAGVTSQTILNQQGGNTLELIQSRVRFATTNSVSESGNVLTLGFDDDFTVDSNGDGCTYNDKDHYEVFKFIGVNSTNYTKCATNKILWYPNKNSTAFRTLVPAGVRNLPGNPIFTVTNQVIVVLRFGVTDIYSRDAYQNVDIQGTAVSLNRPYITNNTMSILP
jgi:type II secretory pathway pseudopilin PulG